MKELIAIVDNSFKITGRGFIFEIIHAESGLSKDTELVSMKTGLIWKVIARVLFDHAVHEQKLFNNENVEYILMNFTTELQKNESINNIVERESNNIYHYFLKPIGHNEKPENGEKLNITYNKTI